ncbi:hypothetical protein [Rhizobium laguerreae]|uniref:hypothetical protein n=1 Tax=Rhizobium laguerreae TaxID=1076926 RepID=UPI001C929C16|nr:hypothetical protein [Rhizobium laguerreae]
MIQINAIGLSCGNLVAVGIASLRIMIVFGRLRQPPKGSGLAEHIPKEITDKSNNYAERPDSQKTTGHARGVFIISHFIPLDQRRLVVLIAGMKSAASGMPD